VPLPQMARAGLGAHFIHDADDESHYPTPIPGALDEEQAVRSRVRKALPRRLEQGLGAR